MKELIIPVQNFDEHDKVEIELRVGAKNTVYQYRLEAFSWDIEDVFSGSDDEISRSLARIHRLKKAISEYDRKWELIQIYTPSKDASIIQVLYRKRM